MKSITKNSTSSVDMKHNYITLDKQQDLIEGVILRELKIHKDQTGQLVETIRSDWLDVINKQDLRFAMQYMSVTPSGVARDEHMWHVHKYQKDRFVCVAGRIVTAIYDPREGSPTKARLNLFAMGPEKENEMYMVLIPEETYHGFIVVSKTLGYLLNFPTQLYNPKDEGRVDHQGELNWRKVRKDFGIENK